MNLTGKTVQWFCANDDGVKTSLLIYPTGNKGNNICVPVDADNTDYQQIMKAVSDGELTIMEAD
tara:strand:+ start:419 stop:610 length:192 start_codon:yes stop_codon:yes gene_type:complete